MRSASPASAVRSPMSSDRVGRHAQLDLLRLLLPLPEPGCDAVDQQKANARRSLVLPATVCCNLGSRLVGHQVVALAEAHDVRVVLGQKPDTRHRLGKMGVSRDDVRVVSFDLDLLEVAERLEEHARVRGLEGCGAEPLAELIRRRAGP